MNDVSIEQCLSKAGGSIYKLTILVSKRAQELAEGAKPLVDTDDKEKPISTALREIAQGVLKAEDYANSE